VVHVGVGRWPYKKQCLIVTWKNDVGDHCASTARNLEGHLPPLHTQMIWRIPVS
jgi:hypothetical protein